MKHDITITFNRLDGSERAKFDNFEDAILFAKQFDIEKPESEIDFSSKNYNKLKKLLIKMKGRRK